MNQLNISDDELVKAIKKGGLEREKALRHLYFRKKVREAIVQNVLANSGNMHQAKDIFHEGIITLDENIREGKYRGQGSLNSYLRSICRFKWLKVLEKERKRRIE